MNDDRDTDPGGINEPDEPAVMTERRFREVLAEVIGTRFVELHERVATVERRMTDVESAVTRALAMRQVAPFVLSLFAVAASMAANFR